MYLSAVFSTLLAWFVGLFIDANIGMGDYTGFLALRIIFPVIVMGLFIMKKHSNNKSDDNDKQ